MIANRTIKLISKKQKLERQLANFTSKYRDETQAVRRLESFAYNHLILISTLDQYLVSELPMKRVVIITIIRVMVFINGLRYIISTLYPSKSVMVLLSDFNYYLPHQRVFSMLNEFGLIIAFVGPLMYSNSRNETYLPPIGKFCEHGT